VASQLATLANFYLTTWEEYHTGVLFLGYFSGPVEGIIIIVVIYFISGFYGECHLWCKQNRGLNDVFRTPGMGE
jgi:hypothetical protein